MKSIDIFTLDQEKAEELIASLQTPQPTPIGSRFRALFINIFAVINFFVAIFAAGVAIAALYLAAAVRSYLVLYTRVRVR